MDHNSLVHAITKSLRNGRGTACQSQQVNQTHVLKLWQDCTLHAVPERLTMAHDVSLHTRATHRCWGGENFHCKAWAVYKA